jgi:diacylglycerol kinase family enzyme
MIANPVASSTTGARLRVVEKALEAAFDLDVETTNDRGHATELARDAAAAGAKAVIVCGGDGTVNEVVNGLLAGSDGTDVVLGVLPGGGTNVLARRLGLPSDLVEATARLLELAEWSATHRITVGRIDGLKLGVPFRRAFAQSCGLGLDGETVRRVEQSGLRSRLGEQAFVWSWFGALRDVRAAGQPSIRLSTPTGPQDVWWATICTAAPMTYWGRRPLTIAPDAGRGGGMDVVAARSAKWIRSLRWAIQALTSARHVRSRDIIHLRNMYSVGLTTSTPSALQADGEYLGRVDALTVTALPAAVPVYAPAG